MFICLALEYGCKVGVVYMSYCFFASQVNAPAA
jgi:hypothetical protein